MYFGTNKSRALIWDRLKIAQSKRFKWILPLFIDIQICWAFTCIKWLIFSISFKFAVKDMLFKIDYVDL